MKKLIAIVLAVSLVLALGAGAVWANSGHPASKATAKVGNIAVIDSEEMGWTTILQNTIKAPKGKDLFIDASLECGLYTQTKVKSKGNEDTSMAEATIKVRVLVNGVEAYPGEVVFARRAQTMTAKFMGILKAGCIIVDPITGAYILDPECLDPEELELILDTMTANSFNFILDDLPSSDVYTIEVQAMIDTDSSAEAGSASATATIGNGSVTVELVRMIHDEVILLSEENP